MDQMLMNIFLIVYILNALYLLKEDLDTKYIPLLWFYPFVLLSGIYYSLHFWYTIWIIPIILYGVGIFLLDIIEYFQWPISSFWEKWKFLDTGIYDYFLYIFIWDLIVSELIQNFWWFHSIIILFIVCIMTGIIGYIFLKLHQKRVKIMMFKENIQSYEELDKALYDRKLKKIWLQSLFGFETQKWSSPLQQEVWEDYQYRVPLFLFGNTFILCYLIMHC